MSTKRRLLVGGGVAGGLDWTMYQQRLRVRLMEQSFDDEAALVYEGEWVCIPQVGHQVLVRSATGDGMLWVVDAVRHVVGIDGRSLHAELKVRKAD